jgi:hypothetical protein
VIVPDRPKPAATVAATEQGSYAESKAGVPANAGAPARPAATSVAGYKDFAWGTASTEIQRRVPDAAVSEGADVTGPDAALIYFDPQLTGPDVLMLQGILQFEPGQMEVLKSREKDIEFVLVEGRLVGVHLTFPLEKVFEQLQSKYGYAQTRTVGLARGNTQQIAAWRVAPRQLVVWESIMNEVWYFDGAWYDRLRSKAAAKSEAGRKATGGRLN